MTTPEVANDLTPQDEDQLRDHEISRAEARRQLELLRHPPPPLHLDRPATVGDGIRRIPESLHQDLLERYAAAAATGRASKFVPASGAASRMFGSLLPYCPGPGAKPSESELPPPEDRASQDPAVRQLMENLERFPFYPAVAAFLEKAGSIGRNGAAVGSFLEHLLTPQGMNYANAPKALIPFHRYGSSVRTAFEEQLVEGAATLADSQGVCRLHFTVVAEAEDQFRALAKRAEKPSDALTSRFEISYSAQSPATDTLAVRPSGEPFRRPDGRLLLRPGGHGSLLRNLQACGGDLVFVKNIDNVVPDSRKGPTLLWKKLLGGYLLQLQERIFAALQRLEGPGRLEGPASQLSEDFDQEIMDLLTEALGVASESIPQDLEERRTFARDQLYRPLRVCGVVVNQGEPGGGPYWVEAPSRSATLQIVEGAQIDLDDPSQAAALQSATHFNPVDLICGLRDHRGDPFDLSAYQDPATAFISEKSHGGRPLKALEHPGLWNGAMARWNTVFVEVPAKTFAPVKTVFDLLRPEHQS